MTRILVATDGSEAAGRAIEYAANLAKNEGADLLIANVIGEGLPESLFVRISNPQQTWLKELLISESAEILSKARDRARSIGVAMVELESRIGDTAQTIVEIAQEKKVDTVVVGKRGAGRTREFLFGSIAQKIVSLAQLPVIVVP